MHPKLKAALLAGALAGLAAFVASLQAQPLQATDLPTFADAGAD